jgi:hypothetical protein
MKRRGPQNRRSALPAMGDNEALRRLFRLAHSVVERELSSGFSGIAEVKGPFSWKLLEHLDELSRERQALLLYAKVKLRFAADGFPSRAVLLTGEEEKEVAGLREHDNTLHGSRRPQQSGFVLSMRQEEFMRTVDKSALASKQETRAAIRAELRASRLPIRIAEGGRRWEAEVGADFTVTGEVDFGSDEQVATFIHVRQGNGLVGCGSFSLLQILGVGTTSWSFMQRGEEKLCAFSILRFYREVCDALRA